MLRPSVITSSSNRPLPELLDEVGRISGVYLFDLLLLRDVDVRSLESTHLGWDTEKHLLDPRPSTQLLADWNREEVAGWITTQCAFDQRVKIAALATYFPDITSLSEDFRRRAVTALANTVCIALELTRREPAIMDDAIVEIVCGNVLDPCTCAECKPTSRIFVSDRVTKYQLLMKSLRETIAQVEETMGGETRFAIGLELEPGETYVLNDAPPLAEIVNLIEGDTDLRAHVGLNLDIAHMKIAQIRADALIPFRDYFVHAHIADHPGAHTHDQFVGAWTSIETPDSEFLEYLQLLRDRALNRGHGLPFSGAVALELEGNDRIRSIHKSLDAMNHLISVVNGSCT